jgi:hypothetical protein
VWRKNGSKLSGSYGIWRERVIELAWQRPIEGKVRLVQQGGESPGPEWTCVSQPGWFAKAPVRYFLDVPETEVSDIHGIDAYGFMDHVKVHIRSEDDRGRLAIESDVDAAPNFRGKLAQKYGLEYYEVAFIYGWVPAVDVHDIVHERREFKKAVAVSRREIEP